MTLLLCACEAFGGGSVKAGGQNMGVSGSAAGGASAGADSSLERCQAPLGTITVDDGRESSWWGAFGSATQVTTISPLLRLAIQQSNCFVITAIGDQRMSDKMNRITDIQRNSGEYRAGSKQHKGQRVAADYFLQPDIVISNSPIGGIGAALGGLINPGVGVVAGSVQSRTSVVTLTLMDFRSQIQLAMGEGSATATNYGAALSLFGGGAGGSLSGFSKTPEGKATVVAFIDAYNKMVVALRSYRAQNVKGGLGRGGTLKVN